MSEKVFLPSYIINNYLEFKFSYINLQNFLSSKVNAILKPRSKMNLLYRSDFIVWLSHLVQACLNSAQSMRDKYAHLRDSGDEIGEIIVEFNDKIKDVNEKYISYSFCYNLRNHCLHQGLPFSSIPIKIVRDEARGGNLTLSPVIDKDILVGNKRLNAKFRELLHSLEEKDIQVFPMITDYFLIHTKLVNDMSERILDICEDVRGQYKEISGSLARKTRGVPALYYGPDPNTAKINNYDIKILRLHELKIIEKEVRYIRKLFETHKLPDSI